MKTTDKLCKDCKHCFKPDSIAMNTSLWKCQLISNIHEEDNQRTNPLTGKLEKFITMERQNIYRCFCDTQRLNGWFLSRLFHDCGYEGRFFEPIITLDMFDPNNMLETFYHPKGSTQEERDANLKKMQMQEEYKKRHGKTNDEVNTMMLQDYQNRKDKDEGLDNEL